MNVVGDPTDVLKVRSDLFLDKVWRGESLQRSGRTGLGYFVDAEEMVVK